jgi:hypothetical protein
MEGEEIQDYWKEMKKSMT